MRLFLPGSRPYFDAESRARILQRIEKILATGQLTMGPMLEEFEAKFAQYIGVKHAIAVNSGATALLLALQYFDLDGGEVIVPVETFVASANAVIVAAGVPRFVNIEPRTLCLDMDEVERNLRDQTRGVMVIHLAGQISPAIGALKKVCEDRGLFLIEDAAHAHGAKIGPRMAGNLGDVGCFSLYATKVMTAGEGGVVTTNNDALADYVRSARNHGQRKGSPLYETVSLNYRMSEVAAAIALEQLAQLDSFVARRHELLTLYQAQLGDVPEIEFLPAYDGIRCSYWKLYVYLSTEVKRDRLVQLMAEKYQVMTQYAYAPLCHQQPVFASLIEDPSYFRSSEEIVSRVICLPMFVGLEESDVAYVVQSLKEAIQEVKWEGRDGSQSASRFRPGLPPRPPSGQGTG